MAAMSSTSPQWDSRNRGFISPAELQQLRQASPANGRPDVHEFPARSPTGQQQHQQQQDPEQPQSSAETAPLAITAPQPRPSIAGNQTHTRTSSFFSFRSKPSNVDWQQQQQRQAEPQSPPRTLQGRRLSKTNGAPSDFGVRAPQISQSKSLGPSSQGPSNQQQQSPGRRTSMGAANPPAAAPPLHPEIRSVVQLTLCHARKVYFSGPLIRRIERQADGQRPAKDDGWSDVWAQLGGTTLSIWDMKEIEEANKQGKEVPPSYVNMTDAFVQVLGSVTVPATPNQPPKKYLNVITLNSAGSNLLLFSCPSTAALVSWATALRLAAWEKSRLEEIYTAHLIRITLPEGKDTRSTLVRGRMEGWVKIRVSGQTDWKRMWMVVTSGSHSVLDIGGTSSTDSTRPTSPNAPRKKRMSDIFSRGHSVETLPLKPLLSFFTSSKPRDKKKALLTLREVSQAFAVYPERPELINRSTLMKLEGLLGDEETAGGMRNREGWLLIMPELEGGNTQAAEMLKWLVGIHDAFELYGRPKPYTWDPRDPSAMMFGYPVGPGRDLLFLEREVAESMDPRDDRTSAVRSRLLNILFERMRGPGSAGLSKPTDAPPSLPPIIDLSPPPSQQVHDLNGQGNGNGDAHYQLPSLDFDAPHDSAARALSPITERSVTRETLADFGRGGTHSRSASQPASRPMSDEQGVSKKPSIHGAPAVVPEAKESTSMFGLPFTSSPPPTSPPVEYKDFSSRQFSTDSQTNVAGSRPDSKLSPSLERGKTTSTESTNTSSLVDAPSAKPSAVSQGSPTRSFASAAHPAPSTPVKPPRYGASSPVPGSPPFSILTSPHSPLETSRQKELPSIEGTQSVTHETSSYVPSTKSSKSPVLTPASPTASFAAPAPAAPASVRQVASQPPAPPPVAHDQNIFSDALFYMQQLDDKSKSKDTASRRIPTTISEGEDDESTSTSEFETRPSEPERKLSTEQSEGGRSTAHTTHAVSQPQRRGTPIAFRETQGPESNVPTSGGGLQEMGAASPFGSRPPLGRKPSGARAPHGSRLLNADTSSVSSPEQRFHKGDAESMTDHSTQQSSVPEDHNADALAALSFLDNDAEPAPPPPARSPSPPPQVTRSPAIDKTVRTDSRPGSSENGSQYRSSFAPSRQAAERKARTQAQQAAHHAAVHRPGRLNGKRTVSGGSGVGWHESSEEEEEEEEEEEDDEDADSDGEPSTTDSKRMGLGSAPAPPIATTRPLRPHSRNDSAEPPADLNNYPHLRQPRNLPPVPRQQQQDDYFGGAQPPQRRMVSDQHPESMRRTQYDEAPMRSQSDFNQHAATRQSIWTQVLEPGRNNSALPEAPTNTRDTFIQIEPASQTMTKAFTPHGLLSAGIQDKQDRSAKRQEVLARESGASLINVPNKPPPPQTGLLGAITAHERERKREGGVGAALTEREREKRLAEDRQRKLDDFQRQQLEMAQTGASMYGGQQFPGFNPMMTNPMMMGMNPMMTGGYMGYPGMMPGYGNPQYMFAAQQAAQAAYQQAMMAFSAGSHVGPDGMQGSPPMNPMNPMMTGGGMGGFDPRMSMMGMPMMGSPMPSMGPMNMGMGGMGMQMTGGSAFDPRFSPNVMDDNLRPPAALGGHSPGQGSSRNSSAGPGSPAGPRPADAPEPARTPGQDAKN